jgi:hypothetical protein
MNTDPKIAAFTQTAMRRSYGYDTIHIRRFLYSRYVPGYVDFVAVRSGIITTGWGRHPQITR